MPVVNVEALIDERVHAIRDAHERTRIARAELDVSGGIDSAVLLLLLARAVGPNNVTAVYTSIHSGEDFQRRAQEVAKVANVPLVELDVTPIFDRLCADMTAALIAAGFARSTIRDRIESDRTVLGSLRSCLRAPIGRGFNRMTGGGIRHGTGNECEDRFIRFYQKGGDGEVDSNPIAMLSKGEVFQIGRGLGVPKSILCALPSPDLHGIGEAHNDEDELKEATGVHWTYSKVDADTGAYTYVGTIERLSRFLDFHPELIGDAEPDWGHLARRARETTFAFVDSDDAVLEYLRSARYLEATTRHKANPNCPTYGDRASLVAAGCLSDELPTDI